MKSATKRLFSLVFSLFLLIGAVVVYFQFVREEYDKLQETKREALAREAVVNGQKTAIKEVRALIDAYQGEAQLQDQVSLALPHTPDAASALVQLYGLAQNNRLIPQSFSISAAAAQTVTGIDAAGDAGRVSSSSPATLVRPLGSLIFQVRFVGTYDDLKAFLKYLETNLRVFDVRTLTIQPSGKPQDALYAYDMTVAAYYQPE